jgi:hypothetical protein
VERNEKLATDITDAQESLKCAQDLETEYKRLISQPRVSHPATNDPLVVWNLGLAACAKAAGNTIPIKNLA